jgi:hypothetical protein
MQGLWFCCLDLTTAKELGICRTGISVVLWLITVLVSRALDSGFALTRAQE